MPALLSPCCQIAPAPARAPAEPVWEQVLRLLPVDVEASARTWGALVRARAVRGAADLLRLVLLYAEPDWSLRFTAGWATLQEIADLSHVALLGRLKRTVPWLHYLVSTLVALNRTESLARPQRVRLLDATTA